MDAATSIRSPGPTGCGGPDEPFDARRDGGVALLGRSRIFRSAEHGARTAGGVHQFDRLGQHDVADGTAGLVVGEHLDEQCHCILCPRGDGEPGE